MLLGALVDAGVPLERIRRAIAALGLDQIELSAVKVQKMGISATKVSVHAPHEHVHRHLPDIERILGASGLDEPVRAPALATFRALAEAEAAVHGQPVEQVHFHEVGALDAIADVVGVMAGLACLGAASVSCRAIPLSHGTVRCAHGLLPVPAPAVMRLADGLPTEPLDIDGETVTPTAAAILRTVVTHWGSAPAQRISAHGYGAGSKDFPRANVLRLVLGERQAGTASAPDVDTLVVLETNVDDMNPEWLPPLLQRLLDGGARDAWIAPILMKKGRPAHTVSALAEPDQAAALREVLYAHTTSIGVREYPVQRHRLARTSVAVATPWGEVRVKVVTLPDGSRRGAPEHDDCLALSAASGVPLTRLYEAALSAWRGGEP